MKARVLIIEDDADTRSLEREILATMGHEAIEAATAKEGVARATAERPDLILMDIRLPSKKRGIGAARILRTMAETRDIPIIFISGYTAGEHARDIEHIPNCAYLVKPFEMHEFIRQVSATLGDRAVGPDRKDGV